MDCQQVQNKRLLLEGNLYYTDNFITRILSILTCISPSPDLDTRFPVASKYSIWCDMLVLLDMDCNKVAVNVETILQWGKNLQQLWKIDYKFEERSQR